MAGILQAVLELHFQMAGILQAVLKLHFHERKFPEFYQINT